MSDLLEKIKEYNVMFDNAFEKNAIIPQLPEDPEHWSDIGVKSSKDLDRYMLLTTVFETAKFKGVELAWVDLLAKTDVQLSQQLQEIMAAESTE